MKAEVIISAEGGGMKTSETRVAGELDIKGAGYTLAYEWEGDKTLVVYDGKTLTSTRVGGVNLSLKFARGKYTDCKIMLSGGEGVFRVYTTELKTKINSTSVETRLKYINDNEKLNLNIKAITEKS